MCDIKWLAWSDPRSFCQSETQFEMLKKVELSVNSHLELMECSRLNQIEFLSTPFDLTTIDLLLEMGLKKR